MCMLKIELFVKWLEDGVSKVHHQGAPARRGRCQLGDVRRDETLHEEELPPGVGRFEAAERIWQNGARLARQPQKRVTTWGAVGLVLSDSSALINSFHLSAPRASAGEKMIGEPCVTKLNNRRHWVFRYLVFEIAKHQRTSDDRRMPGQRQGHRPHACLAINGSPHNSFQGNQSRSFGDR